MALPIFLVFATSLFCVQAQEDDLFGDVPRTCSAASKPSVGEGRNYVFGSHKRSIPLVEYLDDIIGPQFDPPIQFSYGNVAKYLSTGSVEESSALGLDFTTTNSYRSACIQSELGAAMIANEAQLITGSDKTPTGFGAVLMTLASRDDITSVQDVKGKRLGTNRIDNLATQLCFDVMRRNGVHHLQDPEQTIFFSHSSFAVDALLEGRVDVACAAVGQLEKHIHPTTGEPLDLAEIRVLDRQIHENEGTIEGGPYPLLISSRLVPRIPVQALPHVESVVTVKVQQELFAISDHAAAGPAILECVEQQGCEQQPDDFWNWTCSNNNTSPLFLDSVVNTCFENLPDGTLKRCDTTPELALKAYDVLSKIKSKGFTQPIQNIGLRDVMESTGFLLKDPDPRCVRFQNIDEAVTCPPGHFERSTEEIIQQCSAAGLECYERDCLCRPCVEAYEVDFFPSHNGSGVGSGCSKFSVCGKVEQEHSIVFEAIDNVQRENATISGAILSSDDSEEPFVFETTNGTHSYEFLASNMTVGQKIVKIFVDFEEIPESPFRVDVTKRDCLVATGDKRRTADVFGQCVCENGTKQFGSKCIPLAWLIPGILTPVLLLFLVAVQFYVIYKRNQSDNLWKIDADELHFDEHPIILGRGSYGLVILADYRGTQVAVKRDYSASELLDSVRSGGSSSFRRSGANSSFRRSGRSGRSGSGSSSFRRSGSGVSSIRKSSKAGVFGTSSRSQAFWQGLSEIEFTNEMRLLSRLRHPCITTVMGAVVSSKSTPQLVLEYMHFGSLYDLLHNESMILEVAVLVEMLQSFVSGVRFLHSSKPAIIHGDLKSANILVDEKFRAKVTDFGLSRHDNSRATLSTGTDFWMAPELLRGETVNTMASDMWSLGVVVYEMFSRKEPYEGESYTNVIKEIADKSICKRPAVPPNCPKQVAALMNSCLHASPDERPTAVDMDMGLRKIDLSGLKSMDTEKSMTDKLLEQVFPHHVAEALKKGQKIEPEDHESVTIAFSDIVGYTKISSSLSPQKVSDLLDRLYRRFDELVGAMDIFKVETIGDAYMTVANLIKPQPHHASLIARFAVEAMRVASEVAIDTDDPSKGFVRVRFGFHSGPVVSHVVGTRNPRFTLIGDTVNTASRMESNSEAGRIQCSQASFRLISKDPSHPEFAVQHRGIIPVKGKGDMNTYWITPAEEADKVTYVTEDKQQMFIDWHVDILERFIVGITDLRDDDSKDSPEQALPNMVIGSVVERTKDILKFDTERITPEAVDDCLPDSEVKSQLVDLVTTVAHMYKDENAFHNFEHASHVTMSVVGLLDILPQSNPLAHDPLALFAIVFACLVHGVDHPGTSNAQCVAANTTLAQRYHGKSVAEQNSIDLAFALFQDNRYDALRHRICPTQQDLHRFYQLFVKALLSTDIADKELNGLRKANWGRLSDGDIASNGGIDSDLLANLTLEVLMQAADVSHTMQQWAVYQKWNRRLFIENMDAYRKSRNVSPSSSSPSDAWYQSEIGFLDFVILPLAEKLEKLGLPSSYLLTAKGNRERWNRDGVGVVDEFKGKLP